MGVGQAKSTLCNGKKVENFIFSQQDCMILPIICYIPSHFLIPYLYCSLHLEDVLP